MSVSSCESQSKSSSSYQAEYVVPITPDNILRIDGNVSFKTPKAGKEKSTD